MTAQKGRDLLLKIDTFGSGDFSTVAGLRTRRFALNAETVDTTDADSTGRWRELLAGGGARRASVSGSGIFRDAATDAAMRALFFDGGVRDFQLIVPDFGTLEGPFQLTALDYGGEHDGAVTYEIALESAGAMSFTAAS
jgi:TP901-1 family phage major tail protein